VWPMYKDTPHPARGKFAKFQPFLPTACFHAKPIAIRAIIATTYDVSVSNVPATRKFITGGEAENP